VISPGQARAPETSAGAFPACAYQTSCSRRNPPFRNDPDGDANTSYDDNPSGRATFRLYGSVPNNFIFLR